MQNERIDVSDLEEKFSHGLVAGAAKPERVETHNVVAIFNRPSVDQDFIGFAVCKQKTQTMPGGQGEAWDVRMVNGGHSNRAVLPRHVRALNPVHFSALIRSHGYTTFMVGDNAINIDKGDDGRITGAHIETATIDDPVEGLKFDPEKMSIEDDFEVTTQLPGEAHFTTVTGRVVTDDEQIEAPEIDDMLKGEDPVPDDQALRSVQDLVRFSAAVEAVLKERVRQINEEGFTSEKDDEYVDGELGKASICYTYVSIPNNTRFSDNPPAMWPFGSSWWKPRTQRENLIRAGALILAEIERLDRATIREGNE